MRDSEGKPPIAPITVDMSHAVSGSGTPVQDGNITIDTTGNSSPFSPASLTAPGTYDFTASFAGDNNYKPASVTVTAKVVKGTLTFSLVIQ